MHVKTFKEATVVSVFITVVLFSWLMAIRHDASVGHDIVASVITGILFWFALQPPVMSNWFKSTCGPVLGRMINVAISGAIGVSYIVSVIAMAIHIHNDVSVSEAIHVAISLI